MPSTANDPLFVYGSLMFPEVWKGVVGRPADRTEEAHLSGYTAFRVDGESYPGLVAANAADITQGVLVSGLTEEDLETLDAFEGEFYERVEVAVSVERNGKEETHRARTYLVRDGFHDALSDERWDADEFAEKGLRDFIKRFVS